MPSTWNERVLARLGAMDAHLRLAAQKSEHADPAHRAFQPEPVTPLAKFPGGSFDMLAELAEVADQPPAQDEELFGEIVAYFRGAQRPTSPYCLFNLNANPAVDAAAAACLSVVHNVNGLMDAFAGESLLVEQKVARIIGRWAGWPEAMGISCTGGKATMTYALRCAISRAEPLASRDGIRGRHVVFCSAGAHYSVEHVAASLGIGAANCIRIPVDHRGAMSATALQAAMTEQHKAGATIAAVVCCGGTVIDFCCDDTAEIADTVSRFATVNDVTMPYLHFDGVIGWVYLAYRDLTAAELEAAVPEPAARARISEVIRRCRHLERFESIGVDFHKTGLCPYSSSFFVGRSRRFMNDLGSGDYLYSEADFRFGQFRTYRYTVENTRPLHGALAAWINLRTLGRDGYRAYLASLHAARRGVERALARDGRFRMLNDSSLGWEVVFDVPFDGVTDPAQYGDVAIAFMEHCWSRVLAGHELPLFSIVPEFHEGHDPARSRHAFVIYPMQEQSDAFWDAVVEAIGLELRRFEATRAGAGTTARPDGWQKPIR